MTAPQKLTGVQWLVCTIAAIGFAFDIYELLMLPLILKPAIASLSAPLIEAAVTGGAARPAGRRRFAAPFQRTLRSRWSNLRPTA